MKVLVVGGGASGMMAALTAAQNKNNTVILLERQARLGRKLLATGNGRCNLSNLHANVSHYHGHAPEFMQPALAQFSVEDTLAFFRSLGLVTVAEESGKVYPFSDQANSVADVLRFALEANHVDIRCSCEVTKVSKKAKGYQVQTAGESFFCDKLIVTCGGAAGGKLGGTDLGYRLLQQLGHRCTDIRPSLVQVKTDTSLTHALKGVRADAGLTLKQNGAAVAQNAGEVQFTDFGISGPAVFEISRQISGKMVLLLDLLRPLSEEALAAFLTEKAEKMPPLPMENFLTGILHNRLGRVVLQQAGFSLSLTAGELLPEDIRKIAHTVKYFPMTITGVLGFDQAQVTAGGIDTSEFRSDTLESRLAPGVFAAGEVLDIDGDCGGYNLQWAWSSGRLAGKLGER